MSASAEAVLVTNRPRNTLAILNNFVIKQGLKGLKGLAGKYDQRLGKIQYQRGAGSGKTIGDWGIASDLTCIKESPNVTTNPPKSLGKFMGLVRKYAPSFIVRLMEFNNAN